MAILHWKLGLLSDKSKCLVFAVFGLVCKRAQSLLQIHVTNNGKREAFEEEDGDINTPRVM